MSDNGSIDSLEGDDDRPSKRQTVSKTSDRPPRFEDYTSMVVFVVGPEPEPVQFNVYRETIYRYMKGLKADILTTFSDSETPKYRLEDIQPSTFRLFVHWLYHQRLDLDQERSAEEQEKFAQKDPEWAQNEDFDLVRLWIVAERFGLPALQNHILDKTIDLFKSNNNLNVSHFRYVYKNTEAGSPLRRWAVAQCSLITADAFRTCSADFRFPKELLIDFGEMSLRMFMSETLPVQLRDWESSDFHVPIEEDI